jgi:hypothetical protein
MSLSQHVIKHIMTSAMEAESRISSIVHQCLWGHVYTHHPRRKNGTHDTNIHQHHFKLTVPLLVRPCTYASSSKKWDTRHKHSSAPFQTDSLPLLMRPCTYASSSKKWDTRHKNSSAPFQTDSTVAEAVINGKIVEPTQTKCSTYFGAFKGLSVTVGSTY